METIDTLKIKIEEAKKRIPEESLQAINSVDWKEVIVGMREAKGYSFSQLESLEIETELMLCGLIKPEDYPKEIASRMQIPETEAQEIVEYMNEKVFGRIRAELVKILESTRKTPMKEAASTPQEPPKPAPQPIEIKPQMPEKPAVPVKTEEIELESREDMLKSIEQPETIKTPSLNPIMAGKMAGQFGLPKKESEHSLPNMSKTSEKATDKPTIDPYREPIE